LRVKGANDEARLCLIDIKEALHAAAPSAPNAAGAEPPADSAERVVMAARALAPALGNRIAAEFLGKPVVIRELLPQDLKVEIDQLTRSQACKAARYLGNVVGIAHARQLMTAERLSWKRTLQGHRSRISMRRSGCGPASSTWSGRTRGPISITAAGLPSTRANLAAPERVTRRTNPWTGSLVWLAKVIRACATTA